MNRRNVRVRRVVTAEYVVPVNAYTLDGKQMTEQEVRDVEEDPDIAPEVILDNIVDEQVTVTFEDAR